MQMRRLTASFGWITVAFLAGWIVPHPPLQAVHADSRASCEPLAVSLQHTTMGDVLTVAGPSGHDVYVYPVNSSGGRIQCAYGLHVERPGAPIQRENCAPGTL